MRWLGLGAFLAMGCGGAPVGPALSATGVAGLVRPGTPDADRWGAAVHEALLAVGVEPTRETACQVLAVIEQESGYAADPAVPGLGAMARGELEDAARAKLGQLGDDAVDWVLASGPDGEPDFGTRLDAVRTERELDTLYRDLVAFHGDRVWPVGEVVDLVAPRFDDRHNPVATAGSMQVAVAWAEAHRPAGEPRESVRDALYTVEGGVLYGTARLFAGDDPDDPRLRFADYNAGVFASRNAAFQARVADLSGHDLALDGDLMAWSARGRPRWSAEGQTAAALLDWAADAAPELTEARIRRDLKREKTAELEDTATWRAVEAAWTEVHGTPQRARMPGIELDSPKLAGQWTTKAFADRAFGRYQQCLAR